MYHKGSKINIFQFNNYIQNLNLSLSNEYEFLDFVYNENGYNEFDMNLNLIEGKYELTIVDSLNNIVEIIPDIILTDATFDTFGSINYVTNNSTYNIDNLLCNLEFNFYSDSSKKNCNQIYEEINNKYKVIITCTNLSYEKYYLYINNHKGMEFPIQFYLINILDPGISFSIIQPNALIEGIDNEIKIKSNEFYIPYTKSIEVYKYNSTDNSYVDQRTFSVNEPEGSRLIISFIGSDYAIININSPKNGFTYFIHSI